MVSFLYLFALISSIYALPRTKHHYNNKHNNHHHNNFDSCTRLNNQTIIELFNNWNNALLSLKPENVVNLYSNNSVLLATLANEPLDTQAKKLNYFEEFLLKNPYGTLLTTYSNVYTNTPYIDGTYNFEINVFSDLCAPRMCGGINKCTGMCRTNVKARYTYIYVCENSQWKIQHHHSSKFPM